MISNRLKQNFRNEFAQSPAAKLGSVLVALTILAAVFAPVIAPFDPTGQDLLGGQVSPSLTHPLGTDNLGRDVFSRVLYGARVSVLVGVLAVTISLCIGVTLGIVSGYFGGRVDDVIMRGTDTMMTIPGLIIAIAIFGLLGPQQVRVPDPFVLAGLTPEMPEEFVLPGTVIVALGVTGWTRFARIARGEALTLREEEYVLSARAMGAGSVHTMKEHILPNSLTPIMVLATIRVANAILSESSLAFLGFSGATISWGLDIAFGREYLASAWWVPVFPGVAIVVTIIGINLLGDLARDAIDPNISESDRV